MSKLHKKFEHKWKLEPSTGCWIWIKKSKPSRYGMYYIQGRQIAAHRYSWEKINGPIPESLYVLHRCDVPACVNPKHLFLGTQNENMKDCKQKGRIRNSGRIPDDSPGYSNMIQIRTSIEESAAATQAAESKGLTLSDWLRLLIREASGLNK